MIRRLPKSPDGGDGASNNGVSTLSPIHSPAFGSPASPHAFGSPASSPASRPASGISTAEHHIVKSYDSTTDSVSDDKPSSFRIGLNGIPLEMNDRQLLISKNRIGGGRFSDVYKVTSTPSNVTYIIKHIKPDKFSEPSVLREFDNLIHFKGNIHVIQLIAANIYDHEAYFVHEYIPGKTLHAWLRTGPNNEERERIFHQLEVAVRSVHEAGYVHLDLHPNNIWIPDESSKPLFLLDLGSMHRIGNERNSSIRTEGYSPGHFSPIKTNKATVELNEYAMKVLKRNIVPHKGGGNRKTRANRKKHKKYTKKANRK